MNILEDLERILRAEFGANLGKESLAPDKDLLANGIIDSMGVIRLIVSLENTFGIEVKDEDVVPENFQSLDSLAKFVEQKMKEK